MTHAIRHANTSNGIKIPPFLEKKLGDVILVQFYTFQKTNKQKQNKTKPMNCHALTSLS